MKVNVVIRFTDPGAGSSVKEDLSIPLTINFERDDVNKLVNTSWFRTVIRGKVQGTQSRRLRLIYNGRVLNDKTNFRTEVFQPKLRQMAETGDAEDTLTLYVHCLIGDELTPAQLAQEKEMDNKVQEGGTDAPVIGFDRLLLQGVSALDVSDLRRQFQQIYFPGGTETSTEGVTDVEESETRQENVRQLEEQWLESTNGGSFRVNPEPSRPGLPEGAGSQANVERAGLELEGTSHNASLLLGLLIGTFLGVVALVFLMMDDSMFNETHKMAMILGISINLFIAFLRVGTTYSA